MTIKGQSHECHLLFLSTLHLRELMSVSRGGGGGNALHWQHRIRCTVSLHQFFLLFSQISKQTCCSYCDLCYYSNSRPPLNFGFTVKECVFVFTSASETKSKFGSCRRLLQPDNNRASFIAKVKLDNEKNEGSSH